MPGLSVNNVVGVQVTLTPTAAATRNFGSLVIIGPTEGVIDTTQRLRPYSTEAQVATDFGTTAPEYLAATLYFEQSPQPSFVYIGRWAQSPTYAYLHGALLPVASQQMSVWNQITNGSFAITIDGTNRTCSGMNFATASNMNNVASIIQAALPAGAQCVWNAAYQQFNLRGIVTGTSANISYASPTGSGTDISTTAGLSLAAGASAPVAGQLGETPVACLEALAVASTDWYGCMFAPTLSTDITDSMHEANGAFIEAQSPSRVYGVGTTEAAIVDPTQSTDLASVMQSLGYQHSFVQWSSSNYYCAASMFARAFTTDFTANNSMITLKFKVEPGITAETLTQSQAAALASKSCNVFVNYNNATAIIQEGVMCGGYFFDERQGMDWLQNNIQTRVYNILYTTPTKIPQTDAGTHVLSTGVEAACADGVNNGMIAPGQWNGPPIGALRTGDFLPKGYVTYTPPMANQDPSIRAQRIAPTIQCAVKLAGAVHFANVLVSVDR